MRAGAWFAQELSHMVKCCGFGDGMAASLVCHGAERRVSSLAKASARWVGRSLPRRSGRAWWVAAPDRR